MTNCFTKTSSDTYGVELVVPLGSTTNTVAHRANTFGLSSITWQYSDSGVYPHEAYNSLYNITIHGYNQ